MQGHRSKEAGKDTTRKAAKDAVKDTTATNKNAKKQAGTPQ